MYKRQALENIHFGIRIDNSTALDIGIRNIGNGSGGGNVIAGNRLDGIYVNNGHSHEIYGNDIGWFGTQEFSNGVYGIRLVGNANNVQIGAGSNGNQLGNLIAGNRQEGIRILGDAYDNTVANNTIRDNYGNGVLLNGRQNIVGTDGDGVLDFAEGNQIHSNQIHGVALAGTNSFENVVAGNEIGTTGEGQRFGVLVFAGANRNLIGTDGDGISDNFERNDISQNELAGVRIQDSAAGLDVGVISGVTNDAWTLVTLDNNYNNLVVVATPNSEGSTVPLVTRIRNATGNSFEVKVQRADGSDEPVAGIPVHFIAAEEGLHDGFEARLVESTVTDSDSSWVGESQTYIGSYEAPVVVGQVLTYNDPDWSVFWASGQSRTQIPTSDSLTIGKHVGQDSDTSRSNETIGFFVFESGVGETDGRTWGATITSNILGTDNSPGDTGVVNPLEQIPGAEGFLLETSVAIASNATMRGTDGSFAVLNDRHPVSKEALHLVVDEDRFLDAERNHIAESVSYVVFSAGALDNVVSGNTISENGGAGVDIANSGRNYIGTFDFDGAPGDNPEGNQIIDNDRDGILLNNAHQTVIQGNQILENGSANNGAGIRVGIRSTDTQIGVTKIASDTVQDGSMGNQILANAQDGIRITGISNGRSHGTYISGNQLTPLSSGFDVNGRDGIHINQFVSTVIVGGHGDLFNRANLDELSNSITGEQNGIEINGSRAGDINIQKNIIRQSGNSGVRLTDTTRVVVGAFNDDLLDIHELNYIYDNGFDATGNDGTGVYLAGQNSRNNSVESNFIGADEFQNTTGRFNRFAAVGIETGDLSFNEIHRNTIVVGEDLGGVHVHSGTKNSILGNEYAQHGNIATPPNSKRIFLDPGSVVNDPGDKDSGANDLQNHPVIQSIVTNNAGDYVVTFTLHSQLSTEYRVEFYTDDQDSVRTFIGALEKVTSTTNINDTSPAFKITIPSALIQPDGQVYATATEVLFDDSNFPRPQYGSTSEFGPGFQVDDGNGGGTGGQFAPDSRLPDQTNSRTNDSQQSITEDWRISNSLNQGTQLAFVGSVDSNLQTQSLERETIIDRQDSVTATHSNGILDSAFELSDFDSFMWFDV